MKGLEIPEIPQVGDVFLEERYDTSRCGKR
jgi:hypothetical protein